MGDWRALVHFLPFIFKSQRSNPYNFISGIQVCSLNTRKRLDWSSAVIFFSLFCCNLGQEKIMKSFGRRETHLQLTPELSFQVKLHAFLLWASIGSLMPVGILIIRTSNRVQCGRKLKILFYSHVILQMSAVLLATGAAILSIMKFDNSFSNGHQRLGIGLYGLILAQPLISFLRPHRGSKLRSIWYTAHWLLGTAISIIGIINIYLGLHIYDKKTSKNLKIWTLFFTFQVVMIAFIYLLQDRWDYIKKQGEILGNEQIAPSDIQIIASSEHSYRKDLPSML